MQPGKVPGQEQPLGAWGTAAPPEKSQGVQKIPWNFR